MPQDNTGELEPGSDYQPAKEAASNSAQDAGQGSNTESEQTRLMTNMLRHLEFRIMQAFDERLSHINQILPVNPTRVVNAPPIVNNSDQAGPAVQFGATLDQLRLSDVSLGANPNRASKIAHLIKSWDIKFDGSSRLSVDNFIYRIESQAMDALGGNFDTFCEHVQSFVVQEAKDWYWRYRRSVRQVT